MSCELLQELAVNGVILPPNEEIGAALINRFKDTAKWTSYRMGVSYRLSPEDREDMMQSVFLKFLFIDWRKTFYRNKLWVYANIHHPSTVWTSEEAAFVLKNYAKIALSRQMLRTAWRNTTLGIEELGGREIIGEVNRVSIISGAAEPGTIDPNNEEFGTDGLASKLEAEQVTRIAKEILLPQEWEVISLQHGFDGHGSRTPAQIARLLSLPRKQTQALLDSALTKLKERISR